MAPAEPPGRSAMTRRVSLVLILFAVLTMLAAIPSEAQSSDPSVSSVYRLQPTSTYQHGCFAPCMCPVMETGGVRGTFRLTRTGSDGSFLYFAVTDVNWLVPTGTGLRISGSGTYRTGS